MIHGQDWSSYQADAPPTDGLAFAFVKRTEGLSYVNPRAHAQVAHARAAGLVVGHYAYPHIANSASAEADFFLKSLGADLHAGDLLCLDWEWYGQKVTAAQARAYKAAFISRIRLKAPGHRVVLYSDVSNWTHVDTDSNCGDGLWIATGGRAPGDPGIKHPWTFHQYSTAGGIDHDVAQFAERRGPARLGVREDHDPGEGAGEGGRHATHREGRRDRLEHRRHRARADRGRGREGRRDEPELDTCERSR